MSITAALSIHGRRQQDGIAIRFEHHQLSWSRLDEIIHRLAAHIASIVPARQALALHLPNCPLLALLFLAAARAGREAQVLDPAWPNELLARVMQQLSPPLSVTTDGEVAERHRAVLVDRTIGFEDAAEALGASGTYRPVPEPPPTLPFYVGFTSGSTGIPKGYRRNHQSWLDSFEGDGAEFNIGPDDVILAPGPMSHSLALYALVRGLNAGAKVVFCHRFRPDSVLRLIRQEGVTVLYGVPAQLGLILDSGDRTRDVQADKVRLILSTGAKWPTEDNRRLNRLFPSAEFCEFYGCSELGYLTLAKASENVPALSVGRAFPGVGITIRDHVGRQLPTGQAGLVFAESPLLFMGYACGDEGGGSRAGKAMSVGDVGYFDEQGFLYLVGRASRMIISSGRNIHPEEIESVLRSHPMISSAAVVGLSDKQRGERLVALLQCNDGQPPTRADIIRYVRGKLPLYKVPRHYGLIGHWPTTPLGKPDFVALRDAWATGRFEPIA